MSLDQEQRPVGEINSLFPSNVARVRFARLSRSFPVKGPCIRCEGSSAPTVPFDPVLLKSLLKLHTCFRLRYLSSRYRGL